MLMGWIEGATIRAMSPSGQGQDDGASLVMNATISTTLAIMRADGIRERWEDSRYNESRGYTEHHPNEDIVLVLSGESE